MRTSLTAAALLVSLLAPLAASAQGERIRVRPRLWLAEFDGEVRGDASSSDPGTDLDMQEDMGLDDERGNWLQIMLAQGQGRTWINAWEIDTDGNTTLTSDESLDGVDFTTGTAVEGDFEIRYANLIREQLLQPFDLFGFPVLISWLSGVEYVDIEFEMTGGGGNSKKGSQYFRPQLGLRIESFLGKHVIFDLHILAFPEIDFDDVEARTLEWQASISFRLGSFISIDGGFRFTNIEMEEDKGGGEKVQADFDLEGFFFGVTVSF